MASRLPCRPDACEGAISSFRTFRRLQVSGSGGMRSSALLYELFNVGAERIFTHTPLLLQIIRGTQAWYQKSLVCKQHQDKSLPKTRVREVPPRRSSKGTQKKGPDYKVPEVRSSSRFGERQCKQVRPTGRSSSPSPPARNASWGKRKRLPGPPAVMA